MNVIFARICGRSLQTTS